MSSRKIEEQPKEKRFVFYFVMGQRPRRRGDRSKREGLHNVVIPGL
jgi:hypothetical protein